MNLLIAILSVIFIIAGIINTTVIVALLTNGILVPFVIAYFIIDFRKAYNEVKDEDQ